jgi:hypothetical protein
VIGPRGVGSRFNAIAITLLVAAPVQGCQETFTDRYPLSRAGHHAFNLVHPCRTSYRHPSADAIALDTRSAGQRERRTR